VSFLGLGTAHIRSLHYLVWRVWAVEAKFTRHTGEIYLWKIGAEFGRCGRWSAGGRYSLNGVLLSRLLRSSRARECRLLWFQEQPGYRRTAPGGGK
jgi:hypothetical protein